MPKGECRPLSNTLRTSAVPSPSASRSSVMRSALACEEPADFITSLRKKATMPPDSGFAGASVSATSTSQLGKV